MHLGVVEETQTPLGFVYPMFGIPKRDSPESRPILYTRKLNQYLLRRHFQMDTLKMARKLLERGGLSVQDRFDQGLLACSPARGDTQFSSVLVRGERYQWKVLPFGVTNAQRIFTLLVRHVLKFFRSLSIRIVAYIEDLLVMGSSARECKEITNFVKTVLEVRS